jgi:hypothetical protein
VPLPPPPLLDTVDEPVEQVDEPSCAAVAQL